MFELDTSELLRSLIRQMRVVGEAREALFKEQAVGAPVRLIRSPSSRKSPGSARTAVVNKSALLSL